MAEMVLRNEVERLGLDNISISSAGLFVYPGNPPDPKIVNYLTENGIPVKKHEARQMTKEDADWADLILVMEKDHEEMIVKMWPEGKERVELLGKYTSEGQIQDDVMDPYGRSPYHYRLAQAQITLGIQTLVKKLTEK